MNKYHVQINAKNLLVNFEGKTAKYGFIQMFQIEENSPESAEDKIINIIRENKELSEITLNADDDPPKMLLEEIYELSEFNKELPKETGKIWYLEKKWWQFWK
jgi:hypothetical protein